MRRIRIAPRFYALARRNENLRVTDLATFRVSNHVVTVFYTVAPAEGSGIYNFQATDKLHPTLYTACCRLSMSVPTKPSNGISMDVSLGRSFWKELQNQDWEVYNP